MVYDGKDRPMIGEPGVDTLAVKRVEGGRVTFTEKKAGKVVITGTRTISSDGGQLLLRNSRSCRSLAAPRSSAAISFIRMRSARLAM